MLLYLLITVSLVIGLIALYQSNEARKENVRILELLCNHSRSDLESHLNISKTLDLLCEYLKIGGAE